MNMNALRLLMALLAVCISSSIMADRVLMRSGAEYEGQIQDQNKSEIRLRTTAGQVITIQKSEITRMIYGNQTPEQKALWEKQKQEQTRMLMEYQKQEERQRAEKAEKDKLLLQKAEEDRKASGDRKPAIEKPVTGITAFDAAWRSAVLPGWGQYRIGATASGIQAGALFLGAALYAHKQNTAQREALHSYDRQSLYGFVFLAQRGVIQTGLNYELVKQTKGYYHSRLRGYSQSISILSLVYLGQIAHAAWLGHSSQTAWEISLPSENLGFAAADEKPLANARVRTHSEFRRDMPIAFAFNWRF